MRRDIIIGIILSALLHSGILFSQKFINFKTSVKKILEEEPKVQLMTMPKFDPDPPEKVDVVEQEAKPIEIAAPMIADVPVPMTDKSFIQPIQPPPPEGLSPSANVLTIPETRSFRGMAGMEIFDPSKLDRVPSPRMQGEPQYPFEMKRQGISGEVLVDFIVDVSGNVQNAFAAKSTQREFEAAAVQAVSKWRFRPGMKAGQNVNTHMQVPIHFQLNDAN